MAYLQAARTAALRRRKKGAADSGGDDKRTHHAREFSNNSADFWDNTGNEAHTENHEFRASSGSVHVLRRSQTTKGHDYDIPRYQWYVKECYSNNKTEVFVAVLIAINFFVSIIKFQTCPLDVNGNLYCYGMSEHTTCIDRNQCWDDQAAADAQDPEGLHKGITTLERCDQVGGVYTPQDMTSMQECGWPMRVQSDKWEAKRPSSDARWIDACQSTVRLGTDGNGFRRGLCDAGEWHHTETKRYRLVWPKYTVTLNACREEVAIGSVQIGGDAATAEALADATDATPIAATYNDQAYFAVGVNGVNAILRTGDSAADDHATTCTDAGGEWYSYSVAVNRQDLRYASTTTPVTWAALEDDLNIDPTVDDDGNMLAAGADVCVCGGYNGFECDSDTACPSLGEVTAAGDPLQFSQEMCVGPQQEAVVNEQTLTFPRVVDDFDGRTYQACWIISEDRVDTTYTDRNGCTAQGRADREWRTWYPSCQQTYMKGDEETFYGYTVRHGGLACNQQYDCELAGFVWECDGNVLSDQREKPDGSGRLLPVTECTDNGPLILSKSGGAFFFAVECFFAIVFGIELVINMLAHMGRCCKPIYTKGADSRGNQVHTLKEDGCVCNSNDWLFREFYCGPNKGWNIFDFIIVIISLMSVVLPPGQVPGMGILRLFRAFRVFRLFARLGELKKIITAMERALPGVGSASLVLLLVIMIFAILGVNFFGTTNIPVPDHYTAGSKYGWVCSVGNGANRQSLIDPDIIPEPECRYIDPEVWGTKYFGKFTRSFFTLFQVLTGESWAEAVARPATMNFWPASIYFIIYVLICGYILINVVIAVLLDKMMTYDPNEGEGDGDDDKEYVDCLECQGNGHLVGDFDAIGDDDGSNKIMCTTCRGSGQIDIQTLFTEASIKKQAQVIMTDVKALVERSVTQLRALYKLRGIEWRAEIDNQYLQNDVEEEEPALAGRDPQMSQDRHLGHDPAPCEGE